MISKLLALASVSEQESASIVYVLKCKASAPWLPYTRLSHAMHHVFCVSHGSKRFILSIVWTAIPMNEGSIQFITSDSCVMLQRSEDKFCYFEMPRHYIVFKR